MDIETNFRPSLDLEGEQEKLSDVEKINIGV